MAKLNRVGELDTAANPAFERWNGIFERVGWALMAAVLVLGLLGLFGDGPLSHAQAGAEGSALWVRYERFVCNETASRLELHLGGGAPGERTKIWLSRSVVTDGELEGLIPAIEAVELDADRYIYTVPRPSTGGVIVLTLRPVEPGIRRITVGLVDGPEHPITQLVYP